MTRIKWTLCLAGMLLLVSLASARAEENQQVLSGELSWYKGNLHTHSLWSDGNDFPEVIADWYRRQNYNFLALSDHNILSEGERWIDDSLPARRGAIDGLKRYQDVFGDWVQTRQVDGKRQVRLRPLNEFRSLVEERGSFLLIQGEEITDRFESLPVHINAHNLRDLIKPRGGNSVREVIRNNLKAVEAQSKRTGRPIFAHLNHPNFIYGVTAEDIADVIQERFFEVYNGHPGVNHLGDEHHVDVERIWDIANTIRLADLKSPPLFGLATDDSHNYFGNRGASPGRGWVMVRAAYLTPESIVLAIKRGDFYASSGVSLKEIAFDKGSKELRIVIDAEQGVSYKTKFIGTRKNYDSSRSPNVDADGKPITTGYRYSQDIGEVFDEQDSLTPTYKLTGKELYVRAVVTASVAPDNPSFKGQKKQAWSQPVGWEQSLIETTEPVATQ